MNNNLIKKLNNEIFTRKNVIGYSKFLQYRIRNGVTIPDEECIRFYVEKKVPLKVLDKRDIIPKLIEDISTDVYISGEWKIIPPIKEVKKPIKTTRIRPIIGGISIGNAAITAGSHGWYYEKKGDILGGTNAHVCSEDSSKTGSVEKRILQPGRYDSNDIENNIIGEYEWHKRVIPIGGNNSNCDIANGIASILNSISKSLGRKSRFRTYLDITNHIDFGTFYITVPYELSLIDFDNSGYNGVGHGYAGSSKTSLICKGEYIEKEGYYPVNTKFVSVTEGDIVYKTGRTSCFNNANVIDRSAVSQVNYGSFTALFDDVIVTDGPLLKGGDSGALVWKKE